MWYVVQTVGGQEKHVLDLINKLVDEELIQESFIPQYEVKKRIQYGKCVQKCCYLVIFS